MLFFFFASVFQCLNPGWTFTLNLYIFILFKIVTLFARIVTIKLNLFTYFSLLYRRSLTACSHCFSHLWTALYKLIVCVYHSGNLLRSIVETTFLPLPSLKVNICTCLHNFQQVSKKKLLSLELFSKNRLH